MAGFSISSGKASPNSMYDYFEQKVVAFVWSNSHHRNKTSNSEGLSPAQHAIKQPASVIKAVLLCPLVSSMEHLRFVRNVFQ